MDDTFTLIKRWQNLIGTLFFGPKPDTPESGLAKQTELQSFKDISGQLAVLCETHGIDSQPLAQAIFVELSPSTWTYTGLSDEVGDQCCNVVKLLEIRLRAKNRPLESKEPEREADSKTDDSKRPRISTESKAVAAFFEKPTLNKKQIAELIGCHPKTLSKRKAPKLHQAMQAYAGPNCKVPSGQKSADGSVEATDYRG